jgi:hypothetical protein
VYSNAAGQNRLINVVYMQSRMYHFQLFLTQISEHTTVLFFFLSTCVQQTEFIFLCILLFVAFFAPVYPQGIMVEMRLQMPTGLHLKCPVFR